MNASYLAEKFSAALPYDRYVQTGTEEQQRRWRQVCDAAALTDAQKQLLAGFVRDMKILVVSGVWCGDCVQQCPLLVRIAEANLARIDLRFVDRDVHRDLTDKVRINAGDRVPVALLLAEDHELCSVFGDRTLRRYRALVVRQLGPSCPTGIVPPDKNELAATLQDWLDEVERIQLMLRLSARLREKHGD
ncbi:MAG TPA: thioredoxin family protein [Gemmataceae bacterium]|nr:thioredoxin family protein [Gemmataceae bacterium]